MQYLDVTCINQPSATALDLQLALYHYIAAPPLSLLPLWHSINLITSSDRFSSSMNHCHQHQSHCQYQFVNSIGTSLIIHSDLSIHRHPPIHSDLSIYSHPPVHSHPPIHSDPPMHSQWLMRLWMHSPSINTLSINAFYVYQCTLYVSMH